MKDSTPLAGEPTELWIKARGFLTVTYSCLSGTKLVLNGSRQGNATLTLPVTFDADGSCDVTATVPSGPPLTVHIPVVVDCGPKIKVGGVCQDFSCQRVISLKRPAAGAVLDIPARDGRGLCYAVKLLDAISNGSSTLTQQKDSDVLSRTHTPNVSGNPALYSEPYLMDRATVRFLLRSARALKLAGGLDPDAPILVDNYVLVGGYAQGAGSFTDPSIYRAYGTADAGISAFNAGGGIWMLGRTIPINVFASSKTASVVPVDVTPPDLRPGQTYNLDVRAEDCGGSRELSNVFLLFR